MNILLVDLGTPREEISEPLGIETLASYVEDEFPNKEIERIKWINSYFRRFEV